MTRLDPVFLAPTELSPPRVNLTTGRSAVQPPTVESKARLESRAAFPPPGREPARTLVDAPATRRAGASTRTTGPRPRWHEISYRDPRKGPMTLRWVTLADARTRAEKVAARIGGSVEIWATFADGSSALVEVVR